MPAKNYDISQSFIFAIKLLPDFWSTFTLGVGQNPISV